LMQRHLKTRNSTITAKVREISTKCITYYT
jgi:hypothetical protein